MQQKKRKKHPEKSIKKIEPTEPDSPAIRKKTVLGTDSQKIVRPCTPNRKYKQKMKIESPKMDDAIKKFMFKRSQTPTV